MKGVHLTLDSWIPYRDEEVLSLRGEALDMEEVEGEWERIKEADKPTLVMGVPHLKFDLLVMGILNEDQTPLRRQLRVQRQAIGYIMVDASGLVFGLVFWRQGKLVSESGEFTPLYQGRLSNFWEGGKLTTKIDDSMASEESRGVELLVFTDNLVFESVFYKGKSKYSCCLSSFLGYTSYR